MSNTWRRLPAATLFTIFAAACSRGGDTPGAAQQAGGALPEGHPPISGQAAMGQQGPGGVVLETMDGGGYTYARLGANGQDIWVAGPVTAVAVGDTVMMVNPMAMGQFTSKALERTFDNLYFADAFRKPGEVAAAAPDVGANTGVVQETMNSGGYTYARVAAGDVDVWLAGPETVVSQGQTISWTGGMVMTGFKSKSLDRTFDQILFVNSIHVVPGG
jgi:hypothetical protein